MRINWGWIGYRWKMRECRHRWDTGDRKGHAACSKCGVWRWYPVSP